MGIDRFVAVWGCFPVTRRQYLNIECLRRGIDGNIVESLRQLAGAEPTRPAKEKITSGTRGTSSKQNPFSKRILRRFMPTERVEPWRNRRWGNVDSGQPFLVVSLLFRRTDPEGATASLLVGFHMADLEFAPQVMLVCKHLVLNLVIGTATIFIMWVLPGGRTFCSWSVLIICFL